MPSKHHAYLMAIVVGSLLAANTAHADRYWDNSTPLSAAGFGTAGGTWAASGDAKWSDDPTGASASAVRTSLITDDLWFGTSAHGLAGGTVIISGTVNAHGLTVGSANTGGLVLNGGTIHLAPTATLTVNNTSTLFNSAMTGAGTSLTVSSPSAMLRFSVNSSRSSGHTVVDVHSGLVQFFTANPFGTAGTTLELKSGQFNIGVTSSVAAYNTTVTGDFGIYLYPPHTTRVTFGSLRIGPQTLSVAAYNASGPALVNFGATTLTGNATFNVNDGSGSANLTLGAITDGGGSYSITKTGTGVLTLTASNSYHGATIINAGTLRLAQRPPVTIPAGLQLMPMGDSITYGLAGTNAGYRGYLHGLLSPIAANFKFLGAGTGNPGALPASPIDQRGHNGFGGYGTEWLTPNLDGLLDPRTINPKVADPLGGYWLTGGNGTGRSAVYPNLLLLQIGSNDFSQQRLPNYRTNLTALLNRFIAVRPAAHLIVANITPHVVAYAAQDAILVQTVTEVVADFQARGKPVSRVDLNTGFSQSWLADAVHPNDTGYQWMATRWHNAILDVYTPRGVANAIPSNSPVTVAAHAQWDLNGNSATIPSLTGNGEVLLGNRGALTVAPGGSITFGGAITGAGSLTKTGAGALTLTGTNTYVGATIVSNGTLTIAGAGKLGGGAYADAIVNNSAFVYRSTAAQTLSGVISGAGSVTKSGTGVLTLTGGNTFTGALNVNEGTLTFSGSGTATPSSVTVAGGARLNLSAGYHTLGNVLTTPWTIAGTLASTVASTTQRLPSNLTLNGGTLTSTVANSNGHGAWGASGGTITITAHGTGNTISGAGNGIGISSWLELATPLSGDTLVVSTKIIRDNGTGIGGVTKSGLGTVTLTGANTYFGATTVSNGTLQLTGSVASPVTVISGATISGTGTINNNLVVNSGAFVAVRLPGNPLTVNSNLTIAGSLHIADAGGFDPGTYTLFTYTGALTNNGLVVGTTPNPYYQYQLDTSVAGQVRLVVSATMASWQMQYFGCTNCPQAALTADPDGDGLANLIERALGLDPTVAGANPILFDREAIDTNTYLRLSVARNPTVTDVLIEGLSAGTLSDSNVWSIATTVIESNTPSYFRVRDALPIETNSQRFLKLRFSMP